MAPLSRWQRIVAAALPWYDPAEQDARIEHTEQLRRRMVRATMKAEDVAAAYAAAAERLVRRR